MTFGASVILFGMPRDAASFMSSFERNVLGPLTDIGGSAYVGGFLNRPSLISNPRSAEWGQIEAPSALLKRFPHVSFHPQSDDEIASDLEYYTRFSDRWNDAYRSLGNLLHQQNSLVKGTMQALRSPADLYIFLRPDLVYLDSLRAVFLDALSSRRGELYTPAWLTCRGLNDRIAITASTNTAKAYGTRIEFGREFVSEYGMGLHSERLLAYVIGRKRIPNRFFSARAARCRLSGVVVKENFSIKWRVKMRTQARLVIAPRTYAK